MKDETEKKLRTLLLIFSESDFLEDENIEKLFDRFSFIRNDGIENLLIFVDVLKEAERREYLAQMITEKIQTVSKKYEFEPLVFSNGNRSNFSNESMTKQPNSSESDFSIYFILNLGGREELKMILADFIQNRSTDETADAYDFINSNLLIPFEPDFIMSNLRNSLTDFMIWQTAYSEYYFFEKEMNRLTDSDFRKAFESFKKRDRRYGA
jgi:Undecaprenyl pyrophosphate synthase